MRWEVRLDRRAAPRLPAARHVRGAGRECQRYRAWRRGDKPDRTRLTDPQAVALMNSIHAEVKGAYGPRRMHRELQGRGHRIGLRRLERLMREHGIRARHKRRFKATTDSKHTMLIAPNLLAHNFTPEAPNRVWTGDTT